MYPTILFTGTYGEYENNILRFIDLLMCNMYYKKILI